MRIVRDERTFVVGRVSDVTFRGHERRARFADVFRRSHLARAAPSFSHIGQLQASCISACQDVTSRRTTPRHCQCAAVAARYLVVEVLERGDISFFWKPSVRSADALPGEEEPARVQSFFLVLSTGDKHRRVRVGKKRLPMRAGERLWARVERTGSLARVIGGMVETERYLTKTRGERVQPGAEMIARGAYAFVQHDDHCHLVYRLDDTEPGVPEEVRVAEAGSLIVLFERTAPGRATWTTVGSPAMLDEAGAECVLVGGDDEPERELGIDLLAA